MVTNVPLLVGRFPANMYLLDINPDWLISGEKQPVGLNINLKKGFGFPKPLLFAPWLTLSQFGKPSSR